MIIICIILTLIISSLPSVEIHRFDNGSSVQIVVENKHPFLEDHGRSLIVINNGAIVEKVKLYSVPNGTTPIHYFYNPEKLIWTFIDSNGHWLILNEDGKVVYYAWNWQDDLPIGIIGKFQYDSDSGDYKFIKLDKNPEKEEVYIYKDPG